MSGTGDVRQVIERLLEHADECNVHYADWARDMRKAAAALESLTAQPAPSRAELVYLLNRLTTAVKGPSWEGWAQPEDVEKLKQQPAPSGWQQRIAALKPWTFDYGSRVKRCYFCGVPDTELRGGTHAASCLWQNAVDALPPEPEALDEKEGD
jgi:hypothetical protein